MQRPSCTSAAVLCLVCLLCGGCLISSSGEKIVQADAKRQAVEFASEAGMIDFTQAVEQRYPHKSHLGNSSFAVPFLIGISERKVLSENAFFNLQVDNADLNKDGILSDAEVNAYLGRRPQNAEEVVSQR